MEQKERALFMNDFYNISNKMNQIRNTPIMFRGNIEVNSAGLQLMEAIRVNPKSNMSEIGSVLGLTKGAVSQMVGKLVAKGLIEKIKTNGNAKDIYLILTERGEQINLEHKSILEKIYQGVNGILGEYDDADIATIHRFLSQMSQYMEQYQKELLEKKGED